MKQINSRDEVVYQQHIDRAIVSTFVRWLKTVKENIVNNCPDPKLRSHNTYIYQSALSQRVEF